MSQSQPEPYVYEGRVYSRFVTGGFSVSELDCLTPDGKRFLPRDGDVIEVTTFIIVDAVKHDNPQKWVKAEIGKLPVLPKAAGTKSRSRIALSHNLQPYSKVTRYIPREQLEVQERFPGTEEDDQEEAAG